jgi:glycosyltransferase involved in cell wall biosynthesis/nucleotide-binding universal stress UspA family protein
MIKPRQFTPFRRVLVPVLHRCDVAQALTAARAITGDDHIILAGLIRVAPGESLSTGVRQARQVRAQLNELVAGTALRRRALVRVSYSPWDELVELTRAIRPDLLVLGWPDTVELLGVEPGEILARPPCDIAVARGCLPKTPARILMSVRGGPQATLALRLALALDKESKAELTALHTRPSNVSLEDSRRAQAFRALDRVLAGLPEVKRAEVESEDPAATLVDMAADHDVVIVGVTGEDPGTSSSWGRVADRLLQQTSGSAIAVKAKQRMPAEPERERTLGQETISVLVDKWFAQNTYHADEFADLDSLLELKRRQGVTISIALPALNEEATVGKVIRSIKRPLMDERPLVDELVLIDSRSTDGTVEIARSLDVPVFVHQDILPQYGLYRGKGEALWKSLYVTRGDLLFWIDTDIVNIHPRFIYGLIGPLLLNPGIQFVKGFYRRPLRVDGKLQAGGGGRVTELTARPLLNLFFPELSGVIQPLSGEYGGRRSLLEQLPFYTGYGVEIGMLIDVLEKTGLPGIAQVDLKERIHRNQPLQALSKMSFAIIQVVINRLERRFGPDLLEDVNTSMKLIREERAHLHLEVQEIIEYARPPMASIPEYAGRGAK